MNQTFQNSAQVLSIGIFFTLMIVGLSATLPAHAARAASRPTACRRATAAPRRPPAAGLDPVRGVPRLQPDPAPARRPRARRAARAHSQAVLTGRTFFPHLISAPFRTGPARGLRFRDRRLPGRRRGFAAARRASTTDADDSSRRRPGARTVGRDAADDHREEQHASSVVRPVGVPPRGDGSDRSRSTRSATCRRWPRRAGSVDYPPIEGVEADLLLVTHEHVDHNASRRRRRSARAALDRGDARLAARRGHGDRLRARRVRRHRTRPEHDLRVRARGVRVATSATSARPRCATSRRRDRRRRSAVPAGRRRPDDGRRGRARDRRALSPRWVVPMHYRTPRIGFLETADEFLAPSSASSGSAGRASTPMRYRRTTGRLRSSLPLPRPSARRSARRAAGAGASCPRRARPSRARRRRARRQRRPAAHRRPAVRRRREAS